MKHNRFVFEKDYESVREFFRECYEINQDMTCWLVQRYEDTMFRLDTMHAVERGQVACKDHMNIWSEDIGIVGISILDDEYLHICIKKGYEYIFEEAVRIGENEFKQICDENGKSKRKLIVVSHDSLTYQAKILKKLGYTQTEEKDYDNVHDILNDYNIILPKGFNHTYGENISKNRKIRACFYGFHSEYDDGNIEAGDVTPSYKAIEQSELYKDSFESLIVTQEGDICSYCFCYVDKKTSTASFEPVCTREKYRKKGFCKQMIHAAFNRLKILGIKKAYVNSSDYRKKVYNSCGFETIDAMSMWTRTSDELISET